MRLAIGKINPQVGPGIFMQRLVKCLCEQFNVKIVKTNPDIFLGVVHLEGAPKGVRTVLRLDGLYWDKARFARNKYIFESIKKANGIIFQSEFARNCYGHYIRCPQNCVILNGVDLNWIRSIPPAKIVPGIVSTAQWRPTKRYKSICKGYIESGLEMPLHLVGEKPADAINHSGIIWHGKKSTEETIAIVKACKYAIHLCQFDFCPNSVIEEVALGLKVLHTAGGGAPEIVKENGLAIPVDGDWDYKVLNGPTEINTELVATYLKKMIEMNVPLQERNDLDISITAKKYYDFLERAC